MSAQPSSSETSKTNTGTEPVSVPSSNRTQSNASPAPVAPTPSVPISTSPKQHSPRSLFGSRANAVSGVFQQQMQALYHQHTPSPPPTLTAPPRPPQPPVFTAHPDKDRVDANKSPAHGRSGSPLIPRSPPRSLRGSGEPAPARSPHDGGSPRLSPRSPRHSPRHSPRDSPAPPRGPRALPYRAPLTAAAHHPLDSLAVLLLTPPYHVLAAFIDAMDAAPCDQDELGTVATAIVQLFHVPATPTSAALAHPMIPLLQTIIAREVAGCADLTTLFRSNNLSARLLSAFGRTTGQALLEQLRGPVAAVLADPCEGVEVDSARLPQGQNAAENFGRIGQLTSGFVAALGEAVVPDALAAGAAAVAHHAGRQGAAGLVFLRVLCPALVAPLALCPSPPTPAQSRALVIISKLLQALANGPAAAKQHWHQQTYAQPFLAHWTPLVAAFLDRAIARGNQLLLQTPPSVLPAQPPTPLESSQTGVFVMTSSASSMPALSSSSGAVQTLNTSAPEPPPVPSSVSSSSSLPAVPTSSLHITPLMLESARTLRPHIQRLLHRIGRVLLASEAPDISVSSSSSSSSHPHHRHRQGTTNSVAVAIEKRGWLQKRGQMNPAWRTRFFVLRDAFLSYYETPRDGKPAGVIALAGASVTADPRGDGGLELHAANGRRFFLRAKHGRQAEEWRDVLARRTTELEASKRQAAAVPGLEGVARSLVSAVAPSPPPMALSPDNSPDTSPARTRAASAPDTGVLRRGWLTKLGFHVHNWKKRWVVVYNHVLLYYVSPADPLPRGEVELQEALVRPRADDLPLAFEIQTPGRTWVFLARDADDQRGWLESLKLGKAGYWRRQGSGGGGEVVPSLGTDESLLAATKDGWLCTSADKRTWQRRWAVLKGASLLLFRAVSDTHERPELLIPLFGTSVIQSEETPECVGLCFFEIVTRQRRYFFRADDQDDARLWIRVLLPTHNLDERDMLLKSVWGEKKGQVQLFKTNHWVRRLLAMRNGMLYVYKHEEDLSARAVISLQHATVSKRERPDKPFAFTLSTPTRSFLLACESGDEQSGWTHALGRSALFDPELASEAAKLYNLLSQLVFSDL